MNFPQNTTAGSVSLAPARFRSLLVPLDGSAFGEHSLPLALTIARRAGGAVRLVHVHAPLAAALDTGRLSQKSGLDVWLRGRQQAYLDDLVRRLVKFTAVPMTPLLADGGEVATSLCELAGEDTDLVVMATHGRGPLGQLWHGSIAGVLMRRLKAPLLLVRGHKAPVDLSGEPAVRRILIPLDGSEAAEQVLEPALDLGALMDADHTLLRVIRSVPYGRAGTQRSAAEQRHAEAWGYLRGLAERVGRRVRVNPSMVLDDRPTASILWYAQRHDVDLLALTTRGRGPLSRLCRGSVADQLIRRTATPVLVVRPAE